MDHAPTAPSRTLLALFLSLLAAVSCATPPAADRSAPGPDADLAAATRDRVSIPGFVPLWWHPREGTMRFEIERWNEPLLYYVSLSAGLGSNLVGLDRAQIGPQRVVEFRRVGAKVLLVAPNLAWRGAGAEEAVRRGIRDSFAESVLWGFDVVAAEGERVLVDATAFLLRDAHGVARKLADAGQGDFVSDPTRATVLPEATRGFPENTEIEVLETFTTDRAAAAVAATAADARAVSVRVRHSFVALPDPREGFHPRAFRPRCGFFPHTWRDPSGPIDEPLARQVVPRHRISPEHPLVYYVDRAAPEPVRTALLEGARYWCPVFAAAGFPDGFRVELLPEGADLQDVRYNTIAWVNRADRGWSYGNTVLDPRTGEILKGHVSLGALRVRQDVLLLEGLLSPYGEGAATSAQVTETALARIRQLAAHEVGHTLGLTHNFAASMNDRASVMDYPAPLVLVDEHGELDLSRAYASGCGAWDELAIRYGYGVAPPGEEEAYLRGLLAEGVDRGLFFASDADARGNDRAHPRANLWDNGADAVDQLALDCEVRRIALARFGASALKRGRPLAALEEVFVPLYLHHRYQLEAAVRGIGGVDYDHETVGDAPPRGTRPVPAPHQRRALDAVLACLDPSFLEVPESLARLFVPPPPGSTRGRESFAPGGLLLDPLAAAAACADHTLTLLLDPTRAARLVDQHRADAAQPGLGEVLGRLVALGWPHRPPAGETARAAAVRDEVRTRVLAHVTRLATGDALPVRVRARARATLVALAERLAIRRDATPRDAWDAALVRRTLDGETPPPIPPRALPLPPGAPIGCGEPPQR